MTNDQTDADHVTLKQLIAHVTTQLNEAKKESDASGQDKVLKLQTCTLTLDYEVLKIAGGGIAIKVISGKAERDRTMSNHIEVTFASASDGNVYLALDDDGKPIPQV